MNAQTWLINYYWLFLLEYFFPPIGGLGPKGCVGCAKVNDFLILDMVDGLEQFLVKIFHLGTPQGPWKV